MSGTPPRDLGPRDLPPADSTLPTSEGGFSSGAKADRSSKTKKQVQHLLATLEKEGVEIDDKIASIVDAEIAKIEAEISREAINKSKRGGMKIWSAALTCCGLAAFAVVSISVGFSMGVDWFAKAFLEEYHRRVDFIIGEDKKTNGEDK